MSMDTPHISVIIPVFNMDRFLSACLDSILADGTNKCSFEVIAVNDASTDGSAAILADYEKRHPNLRVVRFERNRGVSAARNAGLDHAQGEYVMFCDPDDAFVPGTVDYVENLISVYNPDLIYFKHINVSDQKAPVTLAPNSECFLYDMSNESEAVTGAKRLFSRLWAWNGAFHRRLFSHLRFDERLWPSEDSLWGVQSICRCKRALETNMVLYKYLQREGSCLHRVFLSRVESEIRCSGLIYEEVRRWPYYGSIRSFFFSWLNFGAFSRPVSLLLQLPPKDREKTWELLFAVYSKAFATDVPIHLRYLYRIALTRKNRFLVKWVISPYFRLRCFGIRNALKQFLFGLDKHSAARHASGD